LSFYHESAVGWRETRIFHMVLSLTLLHWATSSGELGTAAVPMSFDLSSQLTEVFVNRRPQT
jgi:hypothetical protein